MSYLTFKICHQNNGIVTGPHIFFWFDWKCLEKNIIKNIQNHGARGLDHDDLYFIWNLNECCESGYDVDGG